MAKKQKVDTPRDGKAWCDVVNDVPLPPIVGKMTLEGLRDADRGYRINGKGEHIPVLPAVADRIGAIIVQQKEDKERLALEIICARMRR